MRFEMRRLLTTLAALAIGMTAFAQYGPGRYGGGRPGYYSGYYAPYRGTFELGLSLNHFTTGTRDGITVTRPDRAGLFGEYRMNLDGYFDMGLQLSTTFGRGVAGTYETSYWQGAPLLMADFNLLPYTPFNPYIGVGIGPGFGYEKKKSQSSGDWTNALVLSPRAGVELFEHLRLSVQYQWYLSDSHKFSNVAFDLSWAFGPSARGRRGRW